MKPAPKNNSTANVETPAAAEVLDHEIAAAFPLMEGKAFDELVADIKANGLREPIVQYEGKNLDGRNRYRGCLKAGITPRFEPYTGDDPVGVVISRNLRRRHLTLAQRGLAAAMLATLGQGRPGKSGQLAGITQEKAAASLKVAVRNVRRATKVRDHGAPELLHALQRGDVALSAAADIAREPIEKQRKIVRGGKERMVQAAKQIRTEKDALRRVNSTDARIRDERNANLADARTKKADATQNEAKFEALKKAWDDAPVVVRERFMVEVLRMPRRGPTGDGGRS